MKIERLIHRRVGAALRRHRMIEDGDRVLLAVSGGVDSSVMARILAEKRRRIPVRFELMGCHVRTDLIAPDPAGAAWLEAFFRGIGVPLVTREAAVVERMDPGRAMNCFFCAMQRRKALIAAALESGCNKIAYGHHLDDIIETLLLNMLYNAEISTMPARLELDSHDLVIVRPLCATKESEVKRYAGRMEIVAAVPPCPWGERGRRSRVKRIIADLAWEDGRIRDNLAACLERVKVGYLTEKLRGDTPGE
jgi:tRNA(Ile)-lysidine synthase TilS/MesJ